MTCCLGMYSLARDQHICVELLHRDTNYTVIYANQKLCVTIQIPLSPLSHFYSKDSSNIAFGI